MRPGDNAWLVDRIGQFDHFSAAPEQALRRMREVFNMSCVILAITTKEDDHTTHRVTSVIPSVSSYPMRLQIVLSRMSSQGGWTKHRPTGV